MLSDEDRQRIREEEEERFRVRRELEGQSSAPEPQTPNKRKPPEKMSCAAQFGLAVVAILVGLAVINIANQQSEGVYQRPPVSHPGPSTDSVAMVAHDFVRSSLKAPSTAEFSSYGSGDEKVTALGGGKYRVTGWVDSQNGFGAKLRSKWKCVLHSSDGEHWTGDSVEIDPP